MIASPVDRKGGFWELESPLVYLAGDGSTYVVPRRFQTDLASIPAFFRRFFPVNGRHRPAAVLHDWFYATHEIDRTKADAIFYEAMMSCGEYGWKAKMFFYAVRVGGWIAWKNKEK